MNYVPGKGGAAIIAGSATVATAAELPKAGSVMVNEIAIAVFVALVVWAVAYKLISRRTV